jgi:hypothetical protein
MPALCDWRLTQIGPTRLCIRFDGRFCAPRERLRGGRRLRPTSGDQPALDIITSDSKHLPTADLVGVIRVAGGRRCDESVPSRRPSSSCP